jgi:hypothetical protein
VFEHVPVTAIGRAFWMVATDTTDAIQERDESLHNLPYLFCL